MFKYIAVCVTVGCGKLRLPAVLHQPKVRISYFVFRRDGAVNKISGLGSQLPTLSSSNEDLEKIQHSS